MSLLKNYFEKVPEKMRDSGAIAYLAAIDHVQKSSKAVGQSILQELKDQRSHLKLIASENYSSLAVQLAMGNLLTDKYSEGYVAHRFYAGCGNVDTIEALAIEEAKKLFNAEHAYVQPHSGADANMIAFWSILMQKVQNEKLKALEKKSIDDLSPQEYEEIRQLLVNQKVMGMSLQSGGHLTHGYRHNVSSKMMRSVSYDVDPKTKLLDYGLLKKRVKEEKPLILIAGYSAYPGLIDFAKMREIADSAGAVLLVDMAHFAGLVAGRVFKGNFNPVPFAHIVTSTTHKTLRGPRGGLILCKEEFRETIDRACPLFLGGPLPHVMAAKAIAFKEALSPAFETYAAQIVKNAKALAEGLVEEKVEVISGTTENHLILLDVFESFGLTGRQAEGALRQARLTVNRNSIFGDKNGAWYTSGIRLGTPAATTLGMKENEMKEIARIIVQVLKNSKPAKDVKKGGLSLAKAETQGQILEDARAAAAKLLEAFPLYPELIIE